MQRSVLITLMIATSLCLATAAPLDDDIKRFPECKYCGMDREKFGYSRMLVRYEDGTAVPTCSIHCTGIDLALNAHKGVSASLVGDYSTRRLLGAEKAVWVLGGDKMASCPSAANGHLATEGARNNSSGSTAVRWHHMKRS